MVDKKISILIVEDEQAMANALKIKLASAGFVAKIVNNGNEALNELKSNTYNLVLLDLLMPAVDGWGVLKKMTEEKIKVPVIITSNLSQEEDINQAKALGAIDFWVKSDTSLSDVVDRLKEKFNNEK